MEYECSSIDYFPNEEYSPDPSDSTMAIPCEYIAARNVRGHRRDVGGRAHGDGVRGGTRAFEGG